ncbi:MAG: hypothetical protein DHS20C18_10710 [Saprospiraceae bacterium]|nr:MAG: hypothetical protein DHS20C18_10710 [Saprospiraceae bacterium]
MLSTKHIILAIFCLWGGSFDLSAQINADSLEARLPYEQEEHKAGILNQLSMANSEDASDKAILYANQALNLSRQYKDRKNEALALQNLCLGYLYNDIYDKALENGLAALEIFEDLGDLPDKAYILSTLGWLYYDIQNADLALNYHQKVLDIYLQLDDKNNISYGYNSLGLVYSMKMEYEKALSYYLLSLEIAEENDLKGRAAAAHSNLGMTYSSLKSFQLALKHLQKALSLREETSSVLQIAEVWNQLGKTYTGTRQFEEAEASLVKAREFIEQSTSKASQEKLMDNYEYSAGFFAAKGDYKQAFEAFKEYSTLRNIVLSDDKTNRLSEMRLLYETEKKESEIKLLENQKKIDRLIRYSFIVGIILLMIIGYQTYSKLKSKNRQTRLEKESLKDKLDFKNNELTTFALHIAQRNEMLNQFINSLSAIEKETNTGTASELRKLIHQMEQSRPVNQDLEDFHLNVENAYQDFFYNLNKKFPDLTENEKRLSAQVRLQLSNKDIAALNNISVKSVEMARYRLRKRFGLDTKDSLTEFLKGF